MAKQAFSEHGKWLLYWLCGAVCAISTDQIREIFGARTEFLIKDLPDRGYASILIRSEDRLPALIIEPKGLKYVDLNVFDSTGHQLLFYLKGAGGAVGCSDLFSLFGAGGQRAISHHSGAGIVQEDKDAQRAQYRPTKGDQYLRGLCKSKEGDILKPGNT